VLVPGEYLSYIVGNTDRLSAGYSLPGAVIITLPALPAGFEGRYRLLKDVTVIVEGQSEYWDATGELHLIAEISIPENTIGLFM